MTIITIQTSKVLKILDNSEATEMENSQKKDKMINILVGFQALARISGFSSDFRL